MFNSISDFPWTLQSCCFLAVKLKGDYSSTTYFWGLLPLGNNLGKMEVFENHVRPQRSISSPLHHLGTVCKGYCQAVVTPISESLWKGRLHFRFSSGLDYCNSLLTALHNRALHNLQQAQPPALFIVRKRWFEHIVLIVKPFHQWQQSQWIDYKIVLFTQGTKYGHCL